MTAATIVIVAWQGEQLLPACLDAVLPEGAPVLVVDNASTDGTAALLAKRYPQVRVLTMDRNTGFAGGVAAGLAAITTPVAVLLNTDAVVRPGWLAALLAPLSDPGVAAVSSKLLLPDGRVNSAGGWIDRNGYGHDLGGGEPDDGSWDAPTDVAFGCGAALALRMRAVNEVGGLDPDFFLYYEDLDLCWRLWLAGWRCVYEPTAVVVHEQGASAGKGSSQQAYWLERNRLAALLTCATLGLALGQLLRYPLTTASIFLFESRSRALGRIKPWFSVLAWLPALLRRRRTVVTKLSRADYEARFLTRDFPST